MVASGRCAGVGRICRMVGLLACAAGFSPLSAQVFSGDVTDETGIPLDQVTVGLINADRQLVASTTSDANGVFSVRAPVAGTYRVHLTRIGYRSLSGGPYDLLEDFTLEARVVMHRAPAQLEALEVEVEGRVPRLVIAGFYERQAEGFGHFLDREEILRRGSISVAHALDRIPRVWVGKSNELIGTGSMRSPTLVFRGGSVDCVPALWVDGVLVRDGGTLAEPLRLDEYVSINDVAGVEFYGGPATVPIEFSHSGACSVVLVWSRNAGRGQGRPSNPSPGIA